jgi:hypothetical protein
VVGTVSIDSLRRVWDVLDTTEPTGPHWERLLFGRGCVLRNRTAQMPFGEKGRKPGLQQLLRHFIRSGLKAKITKLRPFPAIFRALPADFSALQTVWRRGRNSNLRSPFYKRAKYHVSVLYGILSLKDESPENPWRAGPNGDLALRESLLITSAMHSHPLASERCA